jgi:hypothetical protein
VALPKTGPESITHPHEREVAIFDRCRDPVIDGDDLLPSARASWERSEGECAVGVEKGADGSQVMDRRHLITG